MKTLSIFLFRDTLTASILLMQISPRYYEVNQFTRVLENLQLEETQDGFPNRLFLRKCTEYII
jgi:hypothetical protein